MLVQVNPNAGNHMILRHQTQTPTSVLSAAGNHFTRGGLAAVALATLLPLWFSTAQCGSLLIDRVYTAPMVVVQPTPVSWTAAIFNSAPRYPASSD
jgi:hypothetical protein